jgi:hypothetical protein
MARSKAYMRKRLIRISAEKLTRLKLVGSARELDMLIFGKDDGKYKITIYKAFPFEHDAVTIKPQMSNNIKIEVRASEPQHNHAHFHVTVRGKGDGSYRIDNLQPIESNLSSADEKIIIAWAVKNRQLLIDTWNQFHGYRISVA